MYTSPDFAKSSKMAQLGGQIKKKYEHIFFSQPFIELRGSRTRHFEAETSEISFATDFTRFYPVDLILEPQTFCESENPAVQKF